MAFRGNRGRPPSASLQHLSNLAQIETDECQWALTDTKRVAWGGGSRAPSWISTFLIHGPPPPGKVPVQVCGVPGCVNGRHWKWGDMPEALANRRFKDRAGGNNPNAKLDWDKVSALRAIEWISGAHKIRVAKEYGISIRTLNGVLRGWTWKESDRPSAPIDGDAF